MLLIVAFFTSYTLQEKKVTAVHETVISIFAVAQRNHVTGGLVFLNWVLIADAIAVLVIGSFIWFWSVRQRANYFGVWKMQSTTTQQAIQDKVRPVGRSRARVSTLIYFRFFSSSAAAG